jgi:hypothetical protein
MQRCVSALAGEVSNASMNTVDSTLILNEKQKQSRSSHLVEDVDFSAVPHQDVRACYVPVAAGNVQRGIARLVGLVHVGARNHNKLDYKKYCTSQ